jgi:hypothetical protein
LERKIIESVRSEVALEMNEIGGHRESYLNKSSNQVTRQWKFLLYADGSGRLFMQRPCVLLDGPSTHTHGHTHELRDV